MKNGFSLVPILCTLLFAHISPQTHLRQTPAAAQTCIVTDNNDPQIELSPNPVKVGGQISFSYSGPDNQSVTFRIFNVIGRNVYENTVFHDSGEINDVVNIGQLPKGLYFFQAASNHKTVTHRLLIMS